MIYTLDFVILRYTDDDGLEALLLRRDKEPFENQYALPGGWIFTDTDKSLDDAFNRIVAAKVRHPMAYYEQVETVGSATRDIRGWSTTTVYLAFMEDPLAAIDDDMRWMPITSPEIKDLPFDHTTLIEKAVDRLCSKSQYSSLPSLMVGEEFTLSFLERAYEAILGGPINTSAFRKRMDKALTIEPTERFEKVSGRRPSRFYRRVAKARPEFYERLMTATN